MHTESGCWTALSLGGFRRISPVATGKAELADAVAAAAVAVAVPSERHDDPDTDDDTDERSSHA